MPHDTPSPSTSRIAALLGGGAAVIAVALYAALARTGGASPERAATPSATVAATATDPHLRLAAARRNVAEARRVWHGAATIAPADTRVEASGERVRRFEGFGISVETEPSSADVVVNGRELGQTPLVASVECRPGERVEVEVRRRPHAPQRRVTTCRSDTLVEWSLHLQR